MRRKFTRLIGASFVVQRIDGAWASVILTHSILLCLPNKHGGLFMNHTPSSIGYTKHDISPLALLWMPNSGQIHPMFGVVYSKRETSSGRVQYGRLGMGSRLR